MGSDEDKTQITALRTQYDDPAARSSSSSSGKRNGEDAKPVQAPAVNRGPVGDNEGNAWRAYLRDGDRGGLKHLFRSDEGGARRSCWIPDAARDAHGVGIPP